MSSPLPAGIHPFWFWNTELDEATIDEQLRALAAGGCRGALIHPRQGYPGGYLSARWRELVTHACRSGAALGLAIGACDEFPYPSGNAGGLVVLGQPQRWATDLEQRTLEHAGGALVWDLPVGAVLDCAAFPYDTTGVQWAARRDLSQDVGVAFRQETYRESERDLSAYNGRRYFACDPAPRLETTLPPGRWLVLASLQSTHLQHKYVGPSADTLDPEAMAAFLATTHGRYVGIPLRALFVDEIAPAQWSRHLPGWFRERTGEDLAPLLPAVLRNDHPRALEVRDILEAIRRERFAAAFLTPLRAWCRAHEVVLCEERPLSRLADAGADIPGCDPGHTRIGAPRHDLLGTELRRNARAAAAAGALGSGCALCECGHSLGWGGTLEDLRAITDNLLLNGITHLVPHAAFASTAALRKHDAPPSFFIQQSWWPLHHLLAARVATVLETFAGTTPEIDFAVPPGTAEDVQHHLMASGHGWTFADDAPAVDLATLPIPQRAPWSSEPLVHRMVRRAENRSAALLVNNARRAAIVNLPAGWQPLSLDGGTPERMVTGWLLEPAQSLLATNQAIPLAEVPHYDVPWPTSWQIQAPGGNLLRLGRWALTIAGHHAITTHVPLSEQLRRTGLAVPLAIDPGFGSPARLSLPPLHCSYRAEFTCDSPLALRLLLEPETLVDPGWTMRINDGPVFGATDLSPTTGLPDAALGIEVTSWLRRGLNHITVETTTTRLDGGLRNPLYLHGAFAALPDARLMAPLTAAPFGDVDAAGLPFACGAIEWSAEVNLPSSPSPLALRLPHLVTDAYEVAIDNGPWHAVPWAPRRVLLPKLVGGRHRLLIRQHLTPARCFHGESWDATNHRVVPMGESQWQPATREQ